MIGEFNGLYETVQVFLKFRLFDFSFSIFSKRFHDLVFSIRIFSKFGNLVEGHPRGKNSFRTEIEVSKRSLSSPIKTVH